MKVFVRFLTYSAVLLWLCLPLQASGQTVPPAVHDAVRLPQDGNVTMRGWLGRHLDRCINRRIKPQDIEHLVAPFHRRNETRLWQTEFWGKWITSAQWAYRYNRDSELKSILDTAVQKLLATQSTDGYIGNYRDDAHLQQWDVWGRKYVLLGLLGHYDITGDAVALEAARKVVDHLMTETGPGHTDLVMTGNHRGMASTSILEPVVLLYGRTGDSRCLQFAEYIVKQWELPQGPQLISKALAGIDVAKRFPRPEQWWTWEQGMKAYEMMSCYEGLCELYRVTGQQRYLNAVLETWNNIRAKEINILGAGASMECWYGGCSLQRKPTMHTMETCVTVTWMKFCMQLYRLTGQLQYVDEIERTLYNALLGAMTPEGDNFAKYSAIEGYRALGENQCGMDMHCCNANGPRGLCRIPFLAVVESNEGPVVNLFESGEYTVTLPNGETADIMQQTDYPASGEIRMTVSTGCPDAFPVQIRIPAWSERTQVTVNGEPVAAGAGRYLRIDRQWNQSDEVIVILDMRGRVIPSPDADPAAAVMRGPIVLARDSRLDAQWHEPLLGLKQLGNRIELKQEKSPDPVFHMVFSAPAILDAAGGQRAEERNILLCDYASAGNTWSRDSYYRVWIPLVMDISKQ